MKITRRQLRKIILEEGHKLMLESDASERRQSEMRQFAESRGGARVRSEGSKIKASSEAIQKLATEQTGAMRETLYRMSEFVRKVGESYASIGLLEEGSSVVETLPSLKELKALSKSMKKLE
jgi:flagellar motor component MotA